MDSIREKLMHELEPDFELFSIHLFGYKIPVPDTVVVMWIIMAVLILASWILTRNLRMIPQGRRQLLVESVVGFFNDLCKNVIGHHWKTFAPYIGTIGLFLIFANMISIFNILPGGESLYHLTGLEFLRHIPEGLLKPPTRDINIAVATALLTIFVVLVGSIYVKKPKAWLKSFVEPSPLMLPFKILDYVIRPTSLSLRLFGNILGAFLVMELVYMAVPAALPAALSIYFDLFDGILQAYVFVFLSSFYIAEAVE